MSKDFAWKKVPTIQRCQFKLGELEREIERLSGRIKTLEKWRDDSDRDINELFVEREEAKQWQKEIDDWANVVGDDFDRILERLADLEEWKRNEVAAAANASQEDIQKLKEWQEDYRHIGKLVNELNLRCFKLSEENGLQNEKIAKLEARLDALEGRGEAIRVCALEPEERVLGGKKEAVEMFKLQRLQRALIRAAKGEAICIVLKVDGEPVMVRMNRDME